MTDTNKEETFESYIEFIKKNKIARSWDCQKYILTKLKQLHDKGIRKLNDDCNRLGVIILGKNKEIKELQNENEKLKEINNSTICIKCLNKRK